MKEDTRSDVTSQDIEHRPGVCGGRAVIAGTRMPVWCLARHPFIVCQKLWPHLTEAQIRSAHYYASTHREEIEQDIRDQECDD